MENKKLVKIGWADAIENLEGWHTEKEAIDWAKDDDWIVHQVGWILDETDDYLLFSNKFNEASGGRDSSFGGLFKIPKPWILYKKELTEMATIADKERGGEKKNIITADMHKTSSKTGT